MLRAYCQSSAGNATYTDELLDFSWYVKVNESASLFASIPTVIAILKLATVDSVLRALKKNDIVQVSNANGLGLTLLLRVTEVSILERNKEVQISCAYASMGLVFDGIEGVVSIKKDHITDWLPSEVKTYDGTITNKEFLANVRSKDDLILALAWSYSTRRNIALLPFSTAVANWNSATEAVAMFPDQRPDGTEDGNVPVYMIKPEDIIRYQITPADPPVTYLRSVSLGQLKPMPQIPLQEAHTFLGRLTEDVRAFYSKDLALGMVFTTQYAQSTSTIKYQRLQWTDGIVVESTSANRINVLGMFSNAYIKSTGSTLSVIDRVTGNTLASYAQAFNWYPGLATAGFPVCNTTVIENSDVFVEVAWMCKALIAGGVIAVAKKTAKATGTVTYEFILASAANLASFIDTDAPYMCVANDLPTDTTAAIYGVYDSYVIPQALDTVFIKLKLSGSSILVSYDGAEIDVSSYIDSGLELTIANADAKSHTDTMTELTMVFSIFVTRILDGSIYQKAIQYVYIKNSSVLDSHMLMNADMAVFTSPGLLVIDKDYDYWTLYKANLGLLSLSSIQSGSISKWLGITNLDDVTFAMNSGMLFTVVDTHATVDSSGVYYAYMQLQELSFISRDSSQQFRKVKIAEGQENVLDLKFQVGAIDPSKVYIDKEVGRIEVDFSQFYSMDAGTLDYEAKDIQLLENMATGSYAVINLTPNDPTDFVVVKVIGFKIAYSGLVKAKLYGIIVE